MKDKTLLKLKRKMEAGAKAIEVGDKVTTKIRQAQGKVIADFNKTVISTVQKSKEQITYHEEIIKQAEGMEL